MPYYTPGNEEYDSNGRRRSLIPPGPPPYTENDYYNGQPEMQEARQYGDGYAPNLNLEAQRQAELYWLQQREQNALYQQGYYNPAPRQPQAIVGNYGPSGSTVMPVNNPAPESTTGSTGLYRPKGEHIVRYEGKTTFVPDSSKEGSDYGSTSTRRAKTKKFATHVVRGPFSKRK